MSESLKGKVAVISGAASGFAKATAELFAESDKCNLVLFDINEPGVMATAKTVKHLVQRLLHLKVMQQSPIHLKEL